MTELFDNIYDALLQYNIDLEEVLNHPAGSHEIDDIQKKLNVEFSEEIIDFYTIANGQAEMSDYFVYGHELLSLQGIFSEWKIWKKMSDKGLFCKNKTPLKAVAETGIKANWWNPKWLPITHDGAGNHFCLDFDPDVNGISGQIITLHQDSNKRLLAANSLYDFFNEYYKKILKNSLAIKRF